MSSEHYEQTLLWKKAFSQQNDGLNAQREKIAIAYKDFRGRVAHLLTHIQRELPDLTLHDITHVDALWRVASEIAGPDFELNPAEALVLGGGFLLHDAAHCRAAFPGGITELRETVEWRDAAAQRGLAEKPLQEGSQDFQAVLFDTLRVLHPQQAAKLPFAKWSDGQGNQLHLFPCDELRDAYGNVMGRVAESHWFNPHELEPLASNTVTAPTYLSPAKWTVNPLKVAVLLRVADAAHIDAKRAPRFLLALNRPSGISLEHWRFQARLNQPAYNTEKHELIFSGSPFPVTEQDAWWLAYDAACLADKELSAADHMLRDHRLPQLAAREVTGASSPESFAHTVPTDGWHPVDASVRISDIRSVVERFGGAKLYGDDPRPALRELLQNTRDAVMASRATGALEVDEGSITVQLEERDGSDWLHVTDTGIGMSRYVLTHVLLDFGRSLWKDTALRREWPGLAATGFEAVGRFGIGFFSVFMLGTHVKVTTCCQQHSGGPSSPQWVLEFQKGLESRPSLRTPINGEYLPRHGTRVSVRLLDKDKLKRIKRSTFDIFSGKSHTDEKLVTLSQVVGALAPALEVDVFTQENGQEKAKTVTAGDWRTLPAAELLNRIAPGYLLSPLAQREAAVAKSNLSPIVDSYEIIQGRCAVVENTDSILGIQAGIVTVGGIYGGPINGIAGILTGQQVDRLDRSAAIPTVEGCALIQWADQQANMLRNSKELTWRRSARLIALGADAEELLIIGHGDEDWSVSHLRLELDRFEELWLLEDREYSYDSEIDQVRKSEFEKYLTLDSRIFVVKHGTSINECIQDSGISIHADAAHWPRSLFGDRSSQPAQIFETVLNSAWPDCELVKNQEVAIGEVQGVEIIRSVDIIYKTPRKHLEQPGG